MFDWLLSDRNLTMASSDKRSYEVALSNDILDHPSFNHHAQSSVNQPTSASLLDPDSQLEDKRAKIGIVHEKRLARTRTHCSIVSWLRFCVFHWEIFPELVSTVADDCITHPQPIRKFKNGLSVSWANDSLWSPVPEWELSCAKNLKYSIRLSTYVFVNHFYLPPAHPLQDRDYHLLHHIPGWHLRFNVSCTDLHRHRRQTS